MKTIDIIEYQGQYYNDYQESHAELIWNKWSLAAEDILKRTQYQPNLRIVQNLCVLNNNGFNDIRCIFTFVSHNFHHLVNFSFLNYFFRIGLRFE